jgi:hypothetical protein
MTAECVFHYTYGLCIGWILHAAVLRSELREDTVFCSTHPEWELSTRRAAPIYEYLRTAHTPPATPASCRRGSAQTMLGVYRVEVKPAAAPYTWSELIERHAEEWEVAEINRRTDRLVAFTPAIKVSQWRVSPCPIPASEWLGVDTYVYPDLPWHFALGLPDDFAVDELPPGGAWVRVDPAELLRQYREVWEQPEMAAWAVENYAAYPVAIPLPQW